MFVRLQRKAQDFILGRYAERKTAAGEAIANIYQINGSISPFCPHEI